MAKQRRKNPARQVRYSRLAKKQSQRMARQSILLIIISVLMVFGLIRWGIPALVNYAGFLGEVKSSSEQIGRDDVLAPFAPQIDIAYEATTSAKINVGGFAEAGATVQLYLNNDEIAEQIVDGEGTFEFLAVDLDDGINQFNAKAIDVAGNESPKSSVKSVIFDDTAPMLQITNLENDHQLAGLDNDTYTIEGLTDANVRLYINDRLTRVDSEGNFKKDYKFNEGNNTLKFRAVDIAENVTEIELKVKYDR